MLQALTSTAKQLDVKLQVSRGSTGPLGEIKAGMGRVGWVLDGFGWIWMGWGRFGWVWLGWLSLEKQ